MNPVLDFIQAKFGSENRNRYTGYRWQFYDYIRYPTAGTTQLSFFSVARGGTDPQSNAQKTLEDTNLPQARMLGTHFLLREIRCRVRLLPKSRQHSDLSSDADLIWTTISALFPEFMELLRRGVLNIQLGEKQFNDINQPFLFCGPGHGIEICQHGSAWSEAAIWGQQNPNSKPYGLDPVQFIEENQTIQATVDFPTTSPAFSGLVNSQDPRLQVGLIFDGYAIRPEQ